MRFRIANRFSVSPETVRDALIDPGFVERMSGLPRLGHPTLLDRAEAAGRVTTRIRYAFVGDLNAAVRRVVDPARLTWIEEAVTDLAALRTTVVIIPDNYANLLRCSGVATLRPDAGGAERTLEGELKVSVPLVGGKVEGAILSGMEEHAAALVPVVSAWAAETGRT